MSQPPLTGDPPMVDQPRAKTMTPAAVAFIGGIVGHPIQTADELTPKEVEHICQVVYEAAQEIIDLDKKYREALAGKPNPTDDEIAYGS